TLKMPAFEWVHVQLHQQKGMISLSPPTICNSAQNISIIYRRLSCSFHPAMQQRKIRPCHGEVGEPAEFGKNRTLRFSGHP
ncbi:hypothetical protein ACRWXR_23570, partial [Escherichia coli]